MQRAVRLYFAAGFLLLATFGLHAQSGESQAQEDFALAVAKAHARTSLVTANAKPFAIQASAVSALALHGIGKGTYENKWIDPEHWQRVIQFPDFQMREMRNDSGHSWIERSSDAMPIRIAQMLRFVMIHVPSLTGASAYTVSESVATSEDGKPTTCFSATRPTPSDGLPRHFLWCFDTASGLLVSQDLPLATHITYGSYIAFQDKQEFTHVHVTVSNLSVLDLEIKYEPLDPHALDGLTPGPAMQRSQSTTFAPNPEEVQRGTVEYAFNPPLPIGTPDQLKNQPVQLSFQVGVDSTLVDASVEHAPTQPMAEAALQAARKFTFTPLLVDGEPRQNNFYHSVWFPDWALRCSRGIKEAVPEQPASSGITRSSSTDPSRSTYLNEELSFVFRYPADFLLIPHAQLEDEWSRNAVNPQTDRAKPYNVCNTLLFKAQRLRPGDHIPQVVSIIDLEPLCVFGLVDQKELDSIAVTAAHSVADRWVESSISKPKRYRVNERNFAVVSASGIPHGTAAESLNLLVVVTTIRGHVLAWTIMGPDDNVRQTLAACTVQIGEQRESVLLPLSETP